MSLCVCWGEGGGVRAWCMHGGWCMPLSAQALHAAQERVPDGAGTSNQGQVR